MGIKINKVFLSIVLVLIVSFLLKFSQSTSARCCSPNSQVIRVGIMDNGFKFLDRSETTLFGTSDCYVCDTNTRKVIAKVPQNTEMKFSLDNDKYILSVNSSDNSNYETQDGFTITCPNGYIGVKGLARAGKQSLYRGAMQIVMTPNQNAFYLINLIELEDYLKGVVTNEMPASFGLEALKAQAIAARNYAIRPRTKESRLYDVVDSVASQVYFGYNTETENGRKAVEQTEGIVALYKEEPILALYSSCAGGYTENYSYAFSDPDTKQFPAPLKPYMIPQPDIPGTQAMNRDEVAYQYYTSNPKSFDVKSSYYRWIKTWQREELEQVLQHNLPIQSKTGFVSPAFCDNAQIGTLKALKVIRRGNSGKIMYLDIITSNGKYRVSKEITIRRLFTKDGKALPSANVVFRTDTDSFNEITMITAYGGGFGHGVGMSQYGASYMAQELKKTFDEILKHYYTGISLGTVPVEITNQQITQRFYLPQKGRAVLVIKDRKYLNTMQLIVNGKSCDIDLTRFLNLQRCEIDLTPYLNKNSSNSITFIPSCQNRSVLEHLRKGNLAINVFIRIL